MNIELNPTDHPAGTWLLVQYSSGAPSAMGVVEWADDGLQVNLQDSEGYDCWHPVPIGLPEVLRVLPSRPVNPWITVYDTTTVSVPEQPSSCLAMVDLLRKAERRAERAEQQYGSLWDAAREERDAHREERDELTHRCEALQQQVNDLESRIRENNGAVPGIRWLREWPAGGGFLIAGRAEELVSAFDCLQRKVYQLQAERDMSQQNPCETSAGLTEEEQKDYSHATSELKRNFCLLPDEYSPLLRIIDRLLKAKSVPWVKVDGKRPEGLTSKGKVVCIYNDGVEVTVGVGETASWYWPAIQWCLPLSRLLETLPKGGTP